MELIDVDQEFKDYLTQNPGDNAMEQIIRRWVNHENSGFRDLQRILDILQEIERFDIYDDCFESFQTDPMIFRQQIVTLDDRHRIAANIKPFIYDVFLLYVKHDPEDRQLADKISTFLSNRNMRICSFESLDSRVIFEYRACIELIQTRCRWVVVIVSGSFANSRPEKLFNDITEPPGGAQNNRPKIVPCLRESCVIDGNLHNYVKLKYYLPNSSLFDFWETLYRLVRYDPANEVLNTTDYEYIVPSFQPS